MESQLLWYPKLCEFIWINSAYSFYIFPCGSVFTFFFLFFFSFFFLFLVKDQCSLSNLRFWVFGSVWFDWNWFQSLFSLQLISGTSLTRTNLSHMHCSVKPSLRRQAFTAPEPPTPTHHDRDLAGTETVPIDVDHDRDRADRRRSRSSKSDASRSRSRRSRSKRRSTLRAIAIAIEIAPIAIEIAPIAIAISPRNGFVLLGFIWVFRNEWVWELRKCEKM